ncbi:cysteine-rich KTR domain-containing protein [Congzhengia minquanensis]|uniref:Cysteine-rich KTR domain-containing protein n=1 Tax=Congzhengia minquanensis TaxID=2763657 RepID=A0A926DKQ1_9FIRM|nr:cysteine-rich KTR domain-containing protein [Congzhengia minquanensis]MBC8540713.1 cysteine-rich KTR domain-containing protein [Congzhengia minquanensis]
MKFDKWLFCPICHNKSRVKLRADTELKNFPLFCPKCKNETLVNAKQFNIEVIKEPDAKTQSL